jgi:hypothetical protein
MKMEHTKTEAKIVENAVAVATEQRVQELNELQLAFVGGGIAELVGA